MNVVRRGKITVCVIIAAIITLVSLSVIASQLHWNLPPEGIISSKEYIYQDDGTIAAILWKFRTNNVGDVLANKAIAEKNLPDAIKAADSAKVNSITIQAVQQHHYFIFSISNYYGYAWERKPDGQWVSDEKPGGPSPVR